MAAPKRRKPAMVKMEPGLTIRPRMEPMAQMQYPKKMVSYDGSPTGSKPHVHKSGGPRRRAL